MKTLRATRSSHLGIGKFWRTGLLVLALVLQGYSSRVHYHDIVATTLLTTIAEGNAIGSPIQPIDSDGRDHRCFICHLAGHGSISVLPPTVVLATIPTGFVEYRIAHDPCDFDNAPSAYSSRAPPSLFLQA